LSALTPFEFRVSISGIGRTSLLLLVLSNWWSRR